MKVEMTNDLGSAPTNKIKLITGFVITAIAALSAHAVFTQLGVPSPDMSTVPAPAMLFNRLLTVLALMIFHQLALAPREFSFAKRALLVFLANIMINESLFRESFMEGYCTTAWTFAFVSNGAQILRFAVLSVLIVAVAPWVKGLWRKVLAAAAITALGKFAIAPVVSVLFAPVMAAVAGLAPQSEWCTLPYGWDVLIPAYATFAEPAIAVLGVAALLWDRLSSTRWIRHVQFVLVIMAIKQQLALPFLYAAFSKDPGFAAFVIEGQFALEALTLAALTGLTWEWATGRLKRSSR